MSKKIRAGSSDPAVQKIMKAEKRIEDVPFDIEAWNVLIRDAQGKKIEEARPFFERLVVQVWFYTATGKVTIVVHTSKRGSC